MQFAFATLCAYFACFAVSLFGFNAKDAKYAQRKTCSIRQLARVAPTQALPLPVLIVLPFLIANPKHR
jgi:hypothetical protein